jgi:very-short-patch-repair endonuclease
MQSILLIIIIVIVTVWYFRRHKVVLSKITGQFLVQSPIKPEYDLSRYNKKPFLFDTVSEFRFFSVLTDLVGADYHVFPQVNYSHLIVPHTRSSFEDRRYRSHIERKSADFVVCDKKTCVPCLVVDLDGAVHKQLDVHRKDLEIDVILQAAGLPILRLSNEEALDKELVSEKVMEMLR